MTIVMNMGSGEIERAASTVETNADKVMYAGWNSQRAANCAGCNLPDGRYGIPLSLADADIETFLQKMYACQR
ncbi:MAG: hypothetical protein AUJ90_00725 [Gallionellaceae bacterium CG1_02_60_948]|nr:MAG: hypothetical protein AUJ90_00725 [Gallionellaceae bacterium CG1_02_60_948]